jgi:acyl carrier protein
LTIKTSSIIILAIIEIGVIDMLEQIKPLMAEALNLEEAKITLEATLKDDLGIDSLDAVELIMELEDEFDVKIEDAEAQAFVTIADIVKLLEAKLNK